MTYTYIYMPTADIKAGRFDDVTSVKQIKSATYAYILHFKHGKGGNAVDRYTVYTQEQGRPLQVLWAGYIPHNKLDNRRYHLPYQEVYNGTAQYPPTHFALRGSQYNKAEDIKRMLTDINPALLVYNLQNCSHADLMR